MSLIVPAILTADLNDCNAQIQAANIFCKRVQVDISDGTFAPSVLVPISSLTWPEGLVMDLHIMSAKPSDHLEAILKVKPGLCILHAEVSDDIVSITNKLHAAGIKVGIALLKNSFPGKYSSYIAMADHVLIFASEIGKQGAPADMMQVEKVALVRAIKPEVEIGWDGGANLGNVRALARAGIDVINVGSAISKASDKPAMYQSLIAETEKKGVLI